MLSHTAEYALRAVLYIADRGEGEVVRAEELAQAMDVPRNYLSKTLNQLAKFGVLHSVRGRSGGFSLGAAAHRISLLSIVEVFDPVQRKRTCLLGRSRCSDSNPCPAHERWKGISEQVVAFFRDTTVGDLLREPGKATRALSSGGSLVDSRSRRRGRTD
jgi:Rrf2 family protein